MDTTQQKSMFKFYTRTNYLTKSFVWAAIAFAMVFAIGFASWKIVDSTGILTGLFTGSFGSTEVYASHTGALADSWNKLETLNIVGIVLSIISLVMTMVWMFKITTASKMFIFLAYGTYIVSQGIGFAFMFMSFNVTELIYIFAIAGGIFGLMAICGLVFNLQKFGGFLFIGMIAVMIMSLVTLFMSIWMDMEMMYFIMTIVSGFLFMGYTAFDVWFIKKSSQYMQMSGGMLDPQMDFRMTAFFSFKLLSDMIGLIWMIARIVARNR